MSESNRIEGLQYCARCCIPETQEGVAFDEMGICTACRSSEQKIHIDWVARRKRLEEILERAKRSSGNNYDCILPISGGKDSFFQAHVLTKVFNMRPLAVTFSHNWFSESGFYNLQLCLETFNLDHIQYTPNRSLVNRLAGKSISMIGDTCWHCHAGVGSFPLHIATKFNIPLLVWGESVAESSGRASYNDPVHTFDRDYFLKVSAKMTAQQMADETLSEKELTMFKLPEYEDVAAAGVYGIHLGDFVFWDDERQTEFVRDTYGWLETDIEGSYKGYKSAECVMAGMHDFTCYLKRGFGRSTFHASLDVRNGLLSREEGFELAAKHDRQRPAALDYYLESTGLSEEEFFAVFEKMRHKRLVGKKLPVEKKEFPHREPTRPFVQQIIEKLRGRKDPREQNHVR